jgi:hypothetical protein
VYSDWPKAVIVDLQPTPAFMKDREAAASEQNPTQAAARRPSSFVTRITTLPIMTPAAKPITPIIAKIYIRYMLRLRGFRLRYYA